MHIPSSTSEGTSNTTCTSAGDACIPEENKIMLKVMFLVDLMFMQVIDIIVDVVTQY